ncbi:hypothetical protein NX059_003789 [Plenodomus lindquistii]|nr:hypothetical protein NX059_003789 [Plenodomus lindquistii]
MMDTRYQELRAKMQSVKDLYHSRHYTQCAKYAEQLLAETDGKKIHPVHLTYLHFYTALSHDTLAREATLKNRHKELSLAERHYLCALTALTPKPSPQSQPQQDESDDSPTSPTFEASHLWQRRSSNAGSVDSTASTASSATSYSYDHDSSSSTTTHARKRGESFQFPRPPSSANGHSNDGPTHHQPIYITNYTASPLACCTTQTYTSPSSSSSSSSSSYNHPLAPQISEFTALLNAHIASVRALKKTSVHAVRFTLPSPKPTSTMTVVRSSHVYDDEEMEGVRAMRRGRVFRKRFDPEVVRRLCGDVLGELEGA